MVKQKAARRARRMVSQGDPQCSFCGKTHADVAKLVGGPGVYICDACVRLCNDILADPAYRDTAPGWQGWQTMSDSDLLATLPGTLNCAENVRDGLQARINELRRREVSWARIGSALEMSRQAAWERFA